jgi:PEGA domain
VGRRAVRALRAAVVIAAALPVVRSGAAAAQDIGLVVHAPAGAPAPAEKVRPALVRAMERTGARGETRPLARAAARLASGSVPSERLDRFTRIEQLAAEGWRGYLEARFADAAARLTEARREAEATLDLGGGLDVYADLALRMGAVALALGREREAELEFRLAGSLDPERAVTDDEFKPAVVERYRAARDRGGPSWRRLVRVRPAGAAVEVNGRAAGAAPIEVVLEEGKNVVVARAPGWSARAQVVTGDASGAPVDLELDEDALAGAATSAAAALSIGQSARRAEVAAQSLVALGELDGVLVVASVWRSGAPALLAQLCMSPPRGCGHTVEIRYGRPDGLARAAGELWRAAQASGDGRALTLLVDSRLVHREAGPARGRAPADGRERWWQSRWLWVGVGGLAVSAVAAGMALTSGRDTEWTLSSDGCEFGRC